MVVRNGAEILTSDSPSAATELQERVTKNPDCGGADPADGWKAHFPDRPKHDRTGESDKSGLAEDSLDGSD